MNHRPDFIIIGAMKCGTSTLHEQLARQPGIYMTTPKEPNFFSDDAQYARGWSWYESLFKHASMGDLRGESSTHYTKLPTHPQAVARMVQALPDVKLIYVVRHPIDRLVSHYIHAWTENWVKESIDDAIDSYEPLTAYSEYARQLEPYVEAYGPQRILVLFFERMVREPQHVLEAVGHFIGYEGELVWHDDVSRQNQSSQRLRKSRWRDVLVEVPVLAQIRRTMIPKQVRERFKALWRISERPTISEENIHTVKETFNEDLERFGKWFGTSISCESFADVALTQDLVWQTHETVGQT